MIYKTLLWIYYTVVAHFLTLLKTPSSSLEKRKFVSKYSGNNMINNFVETGTYLGEMIDEVKNKFNKIYSIEINKKLYLRAKKRFKKYKHIQITAGDSSKKLPRIVKNLKGTSIFWLDAHYSGGITSMGETKTPIEKELKIILNKWIKGSVILIDDARLFVGKKSYPKIDTIKKITSVKGLKCQTVNDIIIIR